jgi:hypothetical protein
MSDLRLSDLAFGTTGPAFLFALAPILIGIKHDSVPMTLQTIYTRNLAGYTLEFTWLVAPGSRRKRIRWIKNEKLGGVLSTPAPAIPLHMLKLSIC